MAIYVVLGVLATLGAIVFLLFTSMRTRTQQVRMASDRLAARWLARGALEVSRYAFAATLEQPHRSGGDVRSGTLSDVVLNDPRGLEQLLQNSKSTGRDDRAFLEQLAGQDALSPIDLWVQHERGWSVTYHVRSLSGTPMDPTTGGLVDPVLKTALIHMAVDVRIGHITETYEGQTSILVTSVLPYVTSRFTLTAVDLGATPPADIQVDALGSVVSGPAPVALFHAPADLADSQDPLVSPSTTAAGLVATGSIGSMDDAQRVLGMRGATYLSSNVADGPVTLRLASGGAPMGQYFQVYTAANGKTSYPAARRLAHQPPALASFRPTEPGTGTVQEAFVQGAVFGYYQGIDRDQLLGQELPGETPGLGTSVLRLMGTAAHPSPGLVYGPVQVGLAAISDLAVDRDASSKDEEDQQAAVGRPLPIRESIDPFLRNAAEGAFTADVATEGSGTASYATLLAFQSQGLPPGMVHNLNVQVDDGTGRQVVVPCELGHSPLRLDLSQYRYGKIFPAYADYQQVMSRRLAIPANATLELASQQPDAAATQLERTAFGGADALRWSSELLTSARMLHTDPVHQEIESSAGTRAYIDTQLAGSASLDSTVRYWKGRDDLAAGGADGAAAFKAIFLKGGSLDLEGLHVLVTPATMTAPAPQLDLGDVTVAPGGGGILEVDTLKLRSVRNPATGGDFIPLVLKAHTLVLDGKGPFEAVFVVTSPPQLTGAATYTLVRGAVVADPGTLDALARPLAVVYDPRLSPLAADADVHYRSRLVFPLGMPAYRAPEHWESML